MIDLAKSLPDDSFINKWAGTDSLSRFITFATGLPSVGSSVRRFLDSLLYVYEDIPGKKKGNQIRKLAFEGLSAQEITDYTESAMNILNALIDAASELAGDEARLKLILGENDEFLGLKDSGKNRIAEFARFMIPVAEEIKNFIKKLEIPEEEMSIDKIKAFSNSASMIMSSFSQVATIFTAKKVDFNVDEYKEAITESGNLISTMIAEINKIVPEDIETSKTRINLISELFKTLQDVEKLTDTKTTTHHFSDVAEQIIKAYKEPFRATDTIDNVKETAKQLGLQSREGILIAKEESKESITDSGKAVAGFFIEGLKDANKPLAGMDHSQTWAIGKDFVIGFKDGIRNNIGLATTAASELGTQSKSALKKSIDSHSPSKDAMKIGGYFGEGYEKGILSFASNIYNAGNSIGEKAKDGLNRSIKNISKMVVNDLDTTPTIRPVLDLSGVRSEAKNINGLLGKQQVEVQSTIDSINAGMHNYSNKDNREVIYAINKLKDSMDNGERNTYNFGDFNYQDDSALNRAVNDLVRAARMERRK